MRGRTIILFVFAALLAGGTALLVRSSLTHRPQGVAVKPAAPAPAPQKSILVAAVAIARGQILKPIDLSWRVWSGTAVAPDFIIAEAPREKGFAGWVAREPFVAGEPIVKTKIVAPGDRGFLAAVLRPGMRAISIAVTQTSDVSGFILPGDHVDVLITLPLPAEGQNGNGYAHKAAQTVLRDVRVIAIDQRLDAKNDQPVLARTVTLEVTPKQSEIVALTDEIGKVSLSLRSLVAGVEDPPAAVAVADAGTATAATAATDSVAAAPAVQPAKAVPGASFTLDSEVSPLLPQPGSVKHNHDDGKVIILRGNGNSGTSAGSPPGN